MKTTAIKWVIGIVTIMFVFASSSWADGKRGRGHGGHGSKYQHQCYKGCGHHYKHRSPGSRHYGPRYPYAKRHRHSVKAHHGNIYPNPLFWLLPFPQNPNKPFVYK